MMSGGNRFTHVFRAARRLNDCRPCEVHTDDHCCRSAVAGNALDHHRRGAVAQPMTAHFGRADQAEQSRLAQRVDGGAGKVAF